MPLTTTLLKRRVGQRPEDAGAGDFKPRRRRTGRDARWLVAAVGVLLLVQILRTPDLRLHFVTGASLTQGALIAAIALGVVLTYRGSGVVNFATGAIAMYVAYFYTELRTEGVLFLPPLPNPLALVEGVAHLFGADNFRLPDIPTQISFGAPLTLPAALALSLVFCVVLGLALHFLVFRPLRTAPPLAKVVASVGVLLLLQAIVIRRFGSAPLATMLGHGTPKQVQLPFSIRMNTEQLIVIGVVIACAIILWALFRFTRFGIATRAAAENEKGAMLLAYSPDVLAGSNWVLSTVICGLLGILVAGNQKSVDPITITLLIIPALSVALVGGLTSFGITVAAAFALAMAQALIPYLGATRSWFPQAAGQALPGVAALLPFLVIVAVMFFNGKALPTRGSVASGRLPNVANPSLLSTRVLAPLAVIGCALALMFFATPNGRLAIITSLIGIVICLSIVVITGYVGQISLAQMMLAGISGFALSKLTTTGIHLRGHTVVPALPFPISPLVAALGAMGVGILVAVPALRVRGVSLAIVTFAFAVAVEEFLFQNPGVNGGFKGAQIKSPGPLDPLKTASIGRGSGANVWFGLFCLGTVVVLCAMAVNLRRSATGRRFLATRSNERAAAAAGVDVTRTKLTAFALAAFIAGIGGALVGYQLGGVNESYFGGTQSLIVFAFAYLGGIACISGAVSAGVLIPGGIVFTVLATVFKVPSDFTLILGSLAVIATAILNPEGVAGGFRSRITRLARRRAGTPPSGAPTAEVPS